MEITITGLTNKSALAVIVKELIRNGRREEETIFKSAVWGSEDRSFIKSQIPNDITIID